MIDIGKTSRKNVLHPTEKPIDLMEYLIETYSREGELVLDFVMGSGSTGVACMNLGRRFVGCDNDLEHGYFGVATQRIEQARARSTGTIPIHSTKYVIKRPKGFGL